MTPGLANLGQVANYDDGDTGVYEALAQSGLLEVDWKKEGEKDADNKKAELKAKEAELKKKELEVKLDKNESKNELKKE